MANHPNIISSVLTANVHSVDELDALDSSTESIIVENNSCNDEDFTELDFSRFTNLKSLIVGDYCFKYVISMNVVGLDHLERIKIGRNSFRNLYGGGYSFSVKNCSRLRELKIGPSSFDEWQRIEIEDLPSLEVIEMGYLHYNRPIFDSASLELKGRPTIAQ